MRHPIAKIALLILALALIAVVTPLCGCGVGKKAATSDTNPAADARQTAPQPGGAAPAAQEGMSKSEAAVAQAKAEARPVLLNFHSTKCIPCIQIEENINKVKPEYEGRVAFVVVDVYDQSEQDFCSEYNIQTIPTTIFIKKDGTVSNGYIGVLDPDRLKQELDALL